MEKIIAYEDDLATPVIEQEIPVEELVEDVLEKSENVEALEVDKEISEIPITSTVTTEQVKHSNYDVEKPEDLVKDKRVLIFVVGSFVILTIALIIIIMLLLTTERQPNLPDPVRNIVYEHHHEEDEFLNLL